MEDLRLVVDLVLALGAAFLGGMVAQRLGQPVLLGYILAGVLIGPNTPGLVADRDRVLLLANLGVAFLMFALGVEFSFAELRRVRHAALVGGAIQIPLTILLGTLAGLAAGWSVQAALLLGGAFAISSSLVALKLLLGRGETESSQGRVALGLGVVQDLSLVPMLALLPVLAGNEADLGVTLLRSLGTAAVALAAVIVLGTRLVPRVLFRVARTGSRELFLLTIVLIALGTGLASHAAGLSFALGAFLVGSLGEAGAGEVVQPEFEAGLEFVRQVLRWHGVAARETEIIVAGRRHAFYRSDGTRRDRHSGRNHRATLVGTLRASSRRGRGPPRPSPRS